MCLRVSLKSRYSRRLRTERRELHIVADGQHGIGGRIWPRGETIKIVVEGPTGQRLGSMGMAGTEIIVKGSASDDVGLDQLRSQDNCSGRCHKRRFQCGGPGEPLRAGKRRRAVRHNDKAQPAFRSSPVMVFQECRRFFCRVQGRRHSSRLRR